MVYASTRGEGGWLLRLGAMPFGGPVRAPVPSSGGGGGGLVGPRGGGGAPRRLTRPGVGLWEHFRGGHLARGGRPSAAPRHNRGPGVGYGRPQAGSNPQTPHPLVERAARTLKSVNPR